MLIERLVIAGSITVVVTILCAAVWSIWNDYAKQAEYQARCAAAGMRYSRETTMRGKVPVSWDYCVDDNGFVREIPPAAPPAARP